MNKIISIISGIPIVFITLTACTADEQISVNTHDEPIEFKVNTEGRTRAAYSYSSSNMPQSFHVWADVNVTAEDGKSIKVPYIKGDKLEKSGNKYKSETKRYWPDNIEYMNFYAYVENVNPNDNPNDKTFDYNNGEPCFKDFTVNEDVTQQHDLLYATSYNVSSLKKQGVPIDLHHALCQVCFEAENKSTTNTLIIHKIEYRGLTDKGTFKFPLTSEEQVSNSNWILPVETEHEHTQKTYVLDDLDVRLAPGERKAITGCKQPDNTMDWSKMLTLIPQKKTKNTAGGIVWNPNKLINEYHTNGPWFIVWLTVLPPEGEEYIKIIDNYPFQSMTDIDWMPGKRYVYEILWEDEYNDYRADKMGIGYNVTMTDYVEEDVPF